MLIQELVVKYKNKKIKKKTLLLLNYSIFKSEIKDKKKI